MNPKHTLNPQAERTAAEEPEDVPDGMIDTDELIYVCTSLLDMGVVDKDKYNKVVDWWQDLSADHGVSGQDFIWAFQTVRAIGNVRPEGMEALARVMVTDRDRAEILGIVNGLRAMLDKLLVASAT